MRKLLLLSFSAISIVSFAQLSSETEPGIDTIARGRGIRKQIEKSWWIGQTEFRNTFDRIRLFDSLGYLIEVDDTYAFNIGFTKNPGKISNKTRYYYDKDGKLLKTALEGSLLPAEKEDTITKLVSRTWQTVNGREVPKEEVFVTKTHGENKEMTYSYFYDADGKLQSESCTISDLRSMEVVLVHTDYFYQSDGLLMQVIEKTDGKTTGQTVYEYEYFHEPAEE